MRLSSEQISCRLMNICYLRSLFGYPNSMILYLLSEQNRPSAIRELVYNLEFTPSLITLARIVGLNDYKLKQGFQQVFNTTVFGYLQQQDSKTLNCYCKILYLTSRLSLDGLAMLVLVPSTALSKSIIVTSWERKAIQVERRATITKL
ncbi:MAG: hypothetical protein RMY34_20195 [Aulosira sp. DedQUE10]|nr:hypothetical protein [Aulosira sp. DedQUE10]